MSPASATKRVPRSGSSAKRSRRWRSDNSAWCASSARHSSVCSIPAIRRSYGRPLSAELHPVGESERVEEIREPAREQLELVGEEQETEPEQHHRRDERDRAEMPTQQSEGAGRRAEG